MNEPSEACWSSMAFGDEFGPVTAADIAEKVKNAAAVRAEGRRTKKVRDYAGHPKPHVAAFIALSRQRYKLMTTDARYDKEILIATHLARLEQERTAAA